MYLQNRVTDLENDDCRGKNVGKGSLESLGPRCTHAVFKMDNQQGPTVQHREICSMFCGSLDGRGVWGRRDTCECMAESLCRPPETITVLLICYTPIQNNKFKKNMSLII